MSRKKVRINKSDYINEYWNKNKAKLTSIFGIYTRISAEDAFKRIAKESIANDIRFDSKKTAKKALDDLIYARTHTNDEIKLRKAKEEAFKNQEDLGAGKKIFDKLSRLNNKIDPGAYNDISIVLPDDVNPITGFNVQREIIGYWDIKGSNVVLAQIEGQVDEDSPFTYYEFIDRSSLDGLL